MTSESNNSMAPSYLDAVSIASRRPAGLEYMQSPRSRPGVRCTGEESRGIVIYQEKVDMICLPYSPATNA